MNKLLSDRHLILVTGTLYGDFAGKDFAVVLQVFSEECWDVEAVRASGLAEAAVDAVVDLAHEALPFFGQEAL